MYELSNNKENMLRNKVDVNRLKCYIGSNNMESQKTRKRWLEVMEVRLRWRRMDQWKAETACNYKGKKFRKNDKQPT